MSRQRSPTRSVLLSNPISTTSSTTHVDRITSNVLPTPLKAKISSECAYKIGTKFTPALVTVEDLRAFLRILGAFHHLREEVRNQTGHGTTPSVAADAWEVFLARAVYRFQLWAKKVVNDVRPAGVGFSSIEIPPLDVILVWHTYSLNPRIYYEDCVRMHKGLLSRGSFPLQDIADTIDSGTFTPFSPAFARSNHFTTRTGLPFDLSPECSPADTALLRCPHCEAKMHVPWTAPDEAGLAQRAFFTKCASCRGTVDSKALQVGKFKRDFELVYRYPDSYTVAGMLLDPKTGVPSTVSVPSPFAVFQKTYEATLEITPTVSKTPITLEQAPFKAFNTNLLQAWIPDDRSTSRRPKCKMDGRSVEDILKLGFTGHVAPYYDDEPEKTPVGLNRLVKYYHTPGPFSIDLVQAIQRQEKFTSRMVELGWTSTTKSSQYLLDQELTRSINQYHAFLDIMACNPKAFLVPTLSIDLAWHTHQLLCDSYRHDTLDLLGTIVDHDDSVEEEHISSSFEKTAELWKAQFGVSYTGCACSPSTSKKKARFTIKPLNIKRAAKKLFAGLQRLKLKTEKKDKHVSFSRSTTLYDDAPEPVLRKADYADFTHRPDLVPPPDSAAEETHPSEHLSIRVLKHFKIDALRKSRELKWFSKQSLPPGKVWGEHVHHHKAAFMGESDGALDWSVRTEQGEPGNCVMGMGEAGMCRAGNYKPRDMPMKPAIPKIRKMPSSGSRVYQGALGTCGGSIGGCVSMV